MLGRTMGAGNASATTEHQTTPTTAEKRARIDATRICGMARSGGSNLWAQQVIRPTPLA